MGPAGASTPPKGKSPEASGNNTSGQVFSLRWHAGVPEPTLTTRLHRRLLLLRHRLCTTNTDQMIIVLARAGYSKGHQHAHKMDKLQTSQAQILIVVIPKFKLRPNYDFDDDELCCNGRSGTTKFSKEKAFRFRIDQCISAHELHIQQGGHYPTLMRAPALWGTPSIVCTSVTTLDVGMGFLSRL